MSVVAAHGSHVGVIVTIDGPAGAGKSTAARGLADRLGFLFLDTGALYRAVALAALRQPPPRDDGLLSRLIPTLLVTTAAGATWLHDEDVTAAIRAPEVARMVSMVAAAPIVREFLTRRQRELAAVGDWVTEGRDQGTVVFPDACCKFFLTADPSARARRRFAEFQSLGRHVTLEEVLRDQQERDRRDEERAIGRLCAAPDAIMIDTSELDAAGVINALEAAVRGRLAGGK